MVRAPRSFMGQIDMGQIDPAAQQQAVASSPLHAKYALAVDRESAYEQLAARLAPRPTLSAPAPAPRPAPSAEPDSWREPDRGGSEPVARRRERAPEPEPDLMSRVLGSSAFRSFTRSAASELGREITRGVFGTRRRR